MSAKQITSYAGATGRVNMFVGAIRSGKSFSWTWLMLKKIRDAGPVGAIVIVGKNRDAIYRNVFEPLATHPAFRMFSPHIHYRQGASTARIFGRTVHIVGAHDAKSENKIRGMTIQLAFCDEVTVLDVGFFKQLLGRMSVDGAQLFGTTNPDSPSHWLKTDYLDRVTELPDWRVFHFTLDDNPSLTDSYKSAIKAEYTGLWYRRFIDGAWVGGDGAIYDMWNDNRHIISWDALPPMHTVLGVGIDYGTTNATAALMLTLGADGVLYLVDEWRYEARDDQARWTDGQLSHGIRSWLASPHLPVASSPHLGCDTVIVDPAAASFRVQLLADGVVTHAADNDVLYGIRLTASLLAAGRLRVTKRCAGFLAEVTGYTWDTTATAHGRDAPIKTADHSLDAARYVIVTTEKRWRPYVDLTAHTTDGAASPSPPR
ncbi:PBSX family phage terminase large subunit [Nocardia transvalensis]|uniref:PBSX family phage terminase large subunit n=1 Tax=Nocardia transvalensis TaxID=37333 RepID=UPI001894958C|nr:PBSX family phage terminase large subunit [Nocardia transvalensis]MBF6332387.1 PBSX family phage terminase large subunit [Nocardia transvalensis]